MKNIIKEFSIKYRLHLFLWLAYIAYETVLVWLVFGIPGRPVVYFVHYILALLLFYTQAHYFFPRVEKYPTKKFLIIPFILISEIIAFVILSFWADELLFYFHLIPPSKSFGLNTQFWLKTVYRCSLFIGFSAGYYFVTRYNLEKRKSEELERIRLINIIKQQRSDQELIKAQNAYLKAQINPHFLFNTLDFIYHSVVPLSESIGEAVITLADMMRYAIDSDKLGDYVILRDEIEQAENYIKLNQIRKKSDLAIKLTYDDEVLDIHFIPLVLLTLVENIFKHGNLSNANNSANVKIYNKGSCFYIETFNLIESPYLKKGLHTGLANIDKRLRIAYGDDIVFSTATVEKHFSVTIAISLKKLKQSVASSNSLKGNDIGVPHVDVDQ